MNERLIADLLTAYRNCPVDGEKLRRHRVVLLDALEDVGSDRFPEAKNRFPIAYKFQGKTYWGIYTLNGLSPIGCFSMRLRHEFEAEEIVRRRILLMFPPSMTMGMHHH